MYFLYHHFFFPSDSQSATYCKCLFCVMASILNFNVMHLTCPCKFLIFGTSHFRLADSKKALALTMKKTLLEIGYEA